MIARSNSAGKKAHSRFYKVLYRENITAANNASDWGPMDFTPYSKQLLLFLAGSAAVPVQSWEPLIPATAQNGRRSIFNSPPVFSQQQKLQYK